jgi:hypothetical protein
MKRTTILIFLSLVLTTFNSYAQKDDRGYVVEVGQ